MSERKHLMQWICEHPGIMLLVFVALFITLLASFNGDDLLDSIRSMGKAWRDEQ
jgi:hypothetical protein